MRTDTQSLLITASYRLVRASDERSVRTARLSGHLFSISARFIGLSASGRMALSLSVDDCDANVLEIGVIGVIDCDNSDDVSDDDVSDGSQRELIPLMEISVTLRISLDSDSSGITDGSILWK